MYLFCCTFFSCSFFTLFIFSFISVIKEASVIRSPTAGESFPTLLFSSVLTTSVAVSPIQLFSSSRDFSPDPSVYSFKSGLHVLADALKETADSQLAYCPGSDLIYKKNFSIHLFIISDAPTEIVSQCILFNCFHK